MRCQAEAQKALRQWVSDFRITARTAFREWPQVLEAYGTVARMKV